MQTHKGWLQAWPGTHKQGHSLNPLTLHSLTWLAMARHLLDRRLYFQQGAKAGPLIIGDTHSPLHPACFQPLCPEGTQPKP